MLLLVRELARLGKARWTYKRGGSTLSGMIRNLLWVAFASVCLFLTVLGVSATEIVFGFGLFAAGYRFWHFRGRPH